jgi:hypothetical protein
MSADTVTNNMMRFTTTSPPERRWGAAQPHLKLFILAYNSFSLEEVIAVSWCVNVLL